MLTLETKQKLSQIIDVEQFNNRDELLALVAYVLLASKEKNHIRSADVADLYNYSGLIEVLNKRLRSRDFRLLGIGHEAARFLAMAQEELKDVEEMEEFLIAKAEELANNLDSINNVKLLKAIRNVEIANEQVKKEIEALEMAENAEKAEAAKQAAIEQGLPALSGTPKQITFAERIRAHCLANLSKEKLGRARSATTAKYWIDNFKQYLPRR
ncbi:TPA: hypothetical protein QB269_000933 [Pasteurella multocida]|nr:hypothetical protein [Pasteurella multocida]